MRSKNIYFVCCILFLFAACAEKKSPITATVKKSSIILNKKEKDGTYYIDTRTQAQVFAPQGLVLDMKVSFPNWGDNFEIKNPQNDFNIFIRFDAAKDEEQDAICKAALMESPLSNLDSSKLKLYPFLKGEFNADMIVTTDKVYPVKNTDPNSAQKANLFQIRKRNLGCYTFLFIYQNANSLAQHSTEKELMEYVRFE